MVSVCSGENRWLFPAPNFSYTNAIRSVVLALFHLSLIQAVKFFCFCKHQKPKGCSVELSLSFLSACAVLSAPGKKCWNCQEYLWNINHPQIIF